MSDTNEKMVAALEASSSRIAVLEQQMGKMIEATSAKNVDEKGSKVMQKPGDAVESSDVPSSEVVQTPGDATESSDAKPPGGGRRRRSRRGKRLRKSRKSRKSRRSRRH
jgi:hypothetical protein